MLLHRLPLAALLVVLTAPAVAADAPTGGRIKKCQDVTGKWHYGDYADQACAKSKVEVLSDQGIKTKEIAAPPTKEELAVIEKNKEETDRLKRQADDQAKRDQILLGTYGHEDDIKIVRDRKLAQTDATIKASEETVKRLRDALGRMQVQKQSETEKGDLKGAAQSEKGIQQTQEQVDRHDAAIAQKRQELDKIRKQYADELERYRELKQKQAIAAPPTQASKPPQ